MGSVVHSGATEDNRSVSVVVPALNEAQWLPLLLNCLAAQTRVPDEVIVADADSTDDTAEIARQHGAVVVRGGRPGVGRNAGAAVARSDLVMFLDADARPEPDFIATALREFADRDLDAATAPIRAVEDDFQYQLAFMLSEAYLRAVRPLSPHAVGLCILVDRQVHERVGGFDESLVLGEDHDYARRVARIGRFRVLRSVKAKTSMRRVRKEGRGQYFRVVLGSELRTLARRPIRKLPDGYEFGAYEADESPRPAPGRVKGMVRQLAKPSSEIQGDAIGVAMISLVAGGLGAVALKVAGAQPGHLRSLGVAAGAIAAVSAGVAANKTRFERPYGPFMSAAVAVASDDVVDASGKVVIRAGVDEICEFHAVRDVRLMTQFHKLGARGRLAIRLKSYEGVRALIDDFSDPIYRNVTYLTARSDLIGKLFDVGFAEIPEPPPVDFINRVEKRLLMWQISLRTGSQRRWNPKAERMAIISREGFLAPETRTALDALIARMREGIGRVPTER